MNEKLITRSWLMLKTSGKQRLLLIFILPFLALSSFSFGQNTNVSGQITGTDGKALPFATIAIKGTTVATASDIDGRYTISIPNDLKDSSLTISIIGFAPKVVKISGQSSINVKLDETSIKLNEVVVVGYGTQKRTDVTGAISSASGEDIEKSPVVGVAQALQGRVAGVQVTSNTGSPNSPVSVRIRGIGTVGNSDPFYIVDGFPTNDIGFLNTSDIVSMDVLKDASACAIYGSRAANGVIIVTTKRGKTGRTNVVYDMYTGWQQPWKKLDLMDAESYAATVNKSRGGIVKKGFEHPEKLGAGTDWQDQIFRTAFMQNHQLSISGGDDKNTFMASGSYFGQDGIVLKSDVKRYTARLAADHKINQKLKVSENLVVSHKTNHQIPEGGDFSSVISNALRIDPVTKVKSPDDKYYSHSPYTVISNPMQMLENANNNWVTDRVMATIYGEYEIFKGFKFKSNAGLDASVVNNYQFQPTFRTWDASAGKGQELDNNEYAKNNQITREFQQYTSTLLENTLSYSTVIKNKHAVDALGGITYQTNNSENVYAIKSGAPSNDSATRYFDAASAASSPGPNGHGEESALLSYLGRLNYAYDGKYLATVNMRIDQSSRFTKANRTGLFPSFSLGWRISKENFMKNIPIISDLKLRAGVGQIGNQNINGVNAFYPFATLVSTGQNYTTGATQTIQSGSAPINAGNPNIKWETVQSVNIGIDAGFFDNKILLNADYFVKSTIDMLVKVPLPLYVGYQDRAFVNAGTVVNKGIEIALTYRKTEGLFNYNIGGNISFITNKVTSLGSGGSDTAQKFIPGATLPQSMGDVSRTDVGQPIASFYGYETAGLFQTQDEATASGQPHAKAGDVRFKGQNYIGSPIPKFTYGFNLAGSFKNFDMSMFFQGSYGNKLYNAMRMFLESGTGTTNFLNSEKDAWTPSNMNTTVPRLNYNASENNNNRVSDRFVEDGSYMRLKTMQIGYTFSKSLMERAKIQKIRIYIAAQNLLTFTKYTGLDPEVGQNGNQLDIGVDRGLYPQARVFSIGGNFTF